MREDLLLLKRMPWKHKVVLMILFISGVVILIVSESSCRMIIKSILLYTVLLIASYYDYRFRIIPDWIHLGILVIGLISIHLGKSLFGFALAPLPFLIVELISRGSIGGGDIKLIGVTGFVLGYSITLKVSMIAMALAILFCTFYYLGNKKVSDQSFPFAPFFLIGFLLEWVICNRC